MIQTQLRAMSFALALPFAVLGGQVAAADAVPASGTLSTDSRVLDFDTGPFTLSNYSYQGVAETCAPEQVFRCDEYTLTIDLPDDYDATHPDDFIRVTTSWEDRGEDFDIYFLDADGNDNGDHSSATGKDPEVTEFAAGAGMRTLIIRVVPYTANGGAPHTRVELLGPTVSDAPAPPMATGKPPQYYVYTPPLADGNGAEPSIGYNLATGRALYYGTGGGAISPVGGQVLQANFPEDLPDPLPAACEADWVDVTPPELGAFDVDGILFTDQATGRTFGSALLSVGPALLGVPGGLIGFNSVFAFTDDDGETWTPGGLGPPQTTLPPGVVGTNVVDGLDHQSVGSGPWAEGAKPATATYDRAVYYCSQGYIEAFCTRSEDGGMTFPSTGVVTYTQADTGCGGLHGHVRVAPDGTVYLPNKNCNSMPAVAVSEDSGLHWEVRYDTLGTSSASDPQMALASDGTGYFCYVGKDGHPHVTVTSDKGKSWHDDVDIGYFQGIQSAVFPQAIAGDPDRAACAFIGSTEAGNYQSADFAGVFYPFVATTYDGGKSWHTVNVSPNDPVQREGGIWLRGGGETNRNLLDFNEITLDEQGRPLFIYTDGCIGNCVQEGPNSFSSHIDIARQYAGRPLYAEFDPPEQAPPEGACLGGLRDQFASHLNWRVPVDNGAQIAGYKIYRGTDPTTLALLTQTDSIKSSFDDTSADAGVTEYSYRITAINAAGEGLFSNVVTLPVTEVPPVFTPCELPGPTLITDGTGDNTGGVPGQDLESLSIAEPADLDGKLVFTIKVDSMTPEPAPGQRWVAYFELPDPPANGDENWYVALSTDTGVTSFEYGTSVATDPSGQDVGVREYHKAGDLDGASGFTTDGTIVLVLDKAVIGSPGPGTELTAITASVRSTTPGTVGGQGLSVDTSDSAGYVLRAADACIAGTRGPLASLVASITSGFAPLTVDFDASDSSDPDGDSITGYSFDFGDGTPAVTQADPRVSHTYRSNGRFVATLTVENSHGTTSTNVARQLILVGEKAAGSQDQGRFGGALGLGLTLPLLAIGAALQRRRRAARLR